MTCASCVNKIETALRKTSGIKEANVSITMNSGKIKYYKSVIGPRDIVNVIDELGFKANVSSNDSRTKDMIETHKKITRKWRNYFLFTLIFAVPLMIIMMLFMFILPEVMKTTESSSTNMSMNTMTTTATNLIYQYHGDFVLLVAGLNLETFLMFLLCTPVQVLLNFRIVIKYKGN